MEAEQNNQTKWITKWNKYPEFDNLEFVKSDNMKIIENYGGKHK